MIGIVPQILKIILCLPYRHINANPGSNLHFSYSF
jgi:hypothetical protein